LFSTFIIEYLLEVGESKVVIFSPSKYTDPLKSIYGPRGGFMGVRVPQVTNG